MAHTESVPITGRKRFIFITHDQLIKIVEKEVEEVSIFLLQNAIYFHDRLIFVIKLELNL